MSDEPNWYGEPIDYLRLAIPKTHNTALFLDDDNMAAAAMVLSNIGPDRRDFQHTDGVWNRCGCLTAKRMLSLFEDHVAHLFVSTLNDSALVYMDVADGTTLLVYKRRCRKDFFAGLDDDIVSATAQKSAAMRLLANTRDAYHQRAMLINSRLG